MAEARLESGSMGIMSVESVDWEAVVRSAETHAAFHVQREMVTLDSGEDIPLTRTPILVDDIRRLAAVTRQLAAECERLAAELARLRAACQGLVDYARRNRHNWQTEKAMDFIRRIDAALSAPASGSGEGAEETKKAP